MNDFSIIRDRGQLTIPESIRKKAGWANPDSVVSLSLKDHDQIVITPHGRQQAVDWDVLWPALTTIREANAKAGQALDTTEFISADRENRQ